MAPSLVRPQGHLSPAEALELAQKAPTILRNNPNAFSSSPLVSLFSASETPEIWIIYENLLLACLRTGDGQAAHQCLERLVIRFGDDNERIMAFKGLVKEAEADNDGELVQVLKEYETILGQNATNIPVAKRRVALLKSTGKISEAISALNSLLDFSPTDAEAWAELADLYLSQGLYSQAIFALEEVLVLTPNAWNIHARMGEVLYMAASASDGSSQQQLAESVKRFARSIELCDDYLRGYYGLKLANHQATNKLLKEPSKPSRQTDADDWAVPDTNTVQKLNEVATQKLAEIVRRNSAKDRLWQGYDESEVAAARDLLSKESVELQGQSLLLRRPQATRSLGSFLMSVEFGLHFHDALPRTVQSTFTLDPTFATSLSHMHNNVAHLQEHGVVRFVANNIIPSRRRENEAAHGRLTPSVPSVTKRLIRTSPETFRPRTQFSRRQAPDQNKTHEIGVKAKVPYSTLSTGQRAAGVAGAVVDVGIAVFA
ncbi:TPR repeat protein oca3 [Colletotrichum fructicola]|nr:TPR repeat protein oca3 [Colletotrichum fructicola]